MEKVDLGAQAEKQIEKGGQGGIIKKIKVKDPQKIVNSARNREKKKQKNNNNNK
jgi:hypothetical protein